MNPVSTKTHHWSLPPSAVQSIIFRWLLRSIYCLLRKSLRWETRYKNVVKKNLSTASINVNESACDTMLTWNKQISCEVFCFLRISTLIFIKLDYVSGDISVLRALVLLSRNLKWNSVMEIREGNFWVLFLSGSSKHKYVLCKDCFEIWWSDKVLVRMLLVCCRVKEGDQQESAEVKYLLKAKFDT